MVAGGAHGAHAVSVHLLPPLLSQSGHAPGLSRMVAVLGNTALRPCAQGQQAGLSLVWFCWRWKGEGFWRTCLAAELLPDIFSSQIVARGGIRSMT